MSRTNEGIAFLRAVVAFPVVLAVILGVLSKQISGWDHSVLLIWILYLGLAMGVWFPFILRPYLTKTASRK